MRLPISHDQFLLAIMAGGGIAVLILMLQRDAYDDARKMYEPKIQRLEESLNTEAARIAELSATLDVLNTLEEWADTKPPISTSDNYLIPWPAVHLVRVPPVVLPFNDVRPPGANCDELGCTLKRTHRKDDLFGRPKIRLPDQPAEDPRWDEL